MSKEEVIKQLKSLKDHCEDFIDKDDENDVWTKDVEALEYAIKVLEEG